MVDSSLLHLDINMNLFFYIWLDERSSQQLEAGGAAGS